MYSPGEEFFPEDNIFQFQIGNSSAIIVNSYSNSYSLEVKIGDHPQMVMFLCMNILYYVVRIDSVYLRTMKYILHCAGVTPTFLEQ